jgi:hypothetical protein
MEQHVSALLIGQHQAETFCSINHIVSCVDSYYLINRLEHNRMSNLNIEGYFLSFRQQASRNLWPYMEFRFHNAFQIFDAEERFLLLYIFMVENFFLNISKSCHRSHGELQRTACDTRAVCCVDLIHSKQTVLFVSTAVIRVIMLLFQLSLVLLTTRRIRSQASSFGIATRCGLDVSVFESVSERDFPYPSIRALRPTHPPVQWVPSLFPGCKKHRVWRRQTNASSAKVKNEWIYISAPPLCWYGMLRGDLYL